MIQSKKDLEYYLKCDKLALKIKENQLYPRPCIDAIWKYQILLRRTEYYKNRQGGEGGYLKRYLNFIGCG